MPPLPLLALGAAAACLAAATAAALADLLAARGDRRVAVQSLAGTGFLLLAAFLALPLEGNAAGGSATSLAWIALGSVGAHLAAIAFLRIRALGPFLLPVAAACAATAPFTGDHAWGRGGAGTSWGAVHGISALGGMVAFALAFASGALYLVQAARLKSDPLRAGRLPDLETLDRINLGALLSALPCWTLSLVAGSLQARESWGGDWMLQRVVTLSAGAWILAAWVTGVRLNATVRGPKVEALSVLAFVLALAALLWGGHR